MFPFTHLILSISNLISSASRHVLRARQPTYYPLNFQNSLIAGLSPRSYTITTALSMARLSNTADERHKSGEDEDKDEDSEAAEVVMSADLRSRIDSLKKLISSGNLVEEYDEIESLFKSELPTHNFDSYLGSRSIHHVSKLRTARPRCEPKLALLREKWNLDEAAFIKHFNEDMMGSCRFVELLVKLADIATLSEALLVLHQKQQLRTSGQHRQPGVNQTALWQPVDAQNALAEFTAQGLCSQPKPMTHKRKRDQVVASDIGEPVCFFRIHFPSAFLVCSVPRSTNNYQLS